MPPDALSPHAEAALESATPQPVALRGLGTAVPPHVIDQSVARQKSAEMFSHRMFSYHRLDRVFETSGIERRQSVVPIEWFDGDRNWTDRTEAFLSGATALVRDAAARALSAAGIGAETVDTVVTVCSTGIATPSLESRIMADLGLSASVKRVPVFGLGCAGGVSGLAIAADMARARPGSTVLLLVVETCTIAHRRDLLTKENIVASALFGDGAAAAVLTTGYGGAASLGVASDYTFPDSLNVMGWRVDPTGFGVIFDRSIPDLIAKDFGHAHDRHLTATGKAKSSDPDARSVICHPGGRKVIEAFEQMFFGGREVLDAERAVLRDHGNMSSATVLFVLDRLMREGRLPASATMMALGPGFTASFQDISATRADA